MKIHFLKALCLVVYLLFGLSPIQTKAVPACPDTIHYTQPDGSIVSIFLKGDEKVNWVESVDGYTLMKNSINAYEFAVLDAYGDLVPSGIQAIDSANRPQNVSSLLSGINKGLSYSPSQRCMLLSIMNAADSVPQLAFPTTGTVNFLIILIQFPDRSFTKTQADFNNLFNQVGYLSADKGSVRDYYKKESYGQLDIVFTVIGPFTAANNIGYYSTTNSRPLITEAVNFADPYVNYADFDNDNDGTVDGIHMIFAGYGAENGISGTIWSHAWNISGLSKDGKNIYRYSCSPELKGASGTTTTGIGVACHELGHVLGAPDYYDTNYDTGGRYSGTGYWDLMSSGSWNYNGDIPAPVNAHTKVKLFHWATATELNSPATVTIPNAEANPAFYIINSTTPNEYWIMENKQSAYLPGHGLLIYHVDKDVDSYGLNGYNNINATHPQRMYPVCANAGTNPSGTPASYGNISSTGCTFPGSTNKTQFTDATLPGMISWAGANTGKPITNIAENTASKTVTITFMGGSSNIPVTGVSLNTASLSLIPAQNSTLTATVSPSNASNKTVTWASNNVGVATVNTAGVVTAVSPGSAIITVTTQDGGKTAQCAVTVSNPSVPVTGVSISPSSLSLIQGQTSSLTATVAPSNATNKTVTWSSNNTSVASVSASGAVTAIAAGSATITVTTQDGNKTASCAVTVATSCSAPMGLRVLRLYADSAMIRWNGSASWYQIHLSTGRDINSTSTTTTIKGLSPGTQYTCKVRSLCGNTWSEYTPEISFTTLSNGVSYCAIKGNTSNFYISNVMIGSIDNTSGNNSGYGDFTSFSTTMAAGSVQTIQLTSTPFTSSEKWLVWIDYNQNGDFTDSGEEVASTDLTASVRTATFTVPAGAAIGSTRMRVARINAGNQVPCGTFDDGEAEDYTVNIVGATVPVTGISVSPASLSLTPGQNSTLTATVIPANATNKTVTWMSSNNTIATVSASGVVVAVAAGSATVSATTQDGDKTASCTVTVTNTVVPVTGVSVSPSNLSLTPGQTSTLTATISPSNATNKNVTWASNNTGAATVSASGVVTAVAGGSAIITVTTQDGHKTASCAVTVTVPVTGVTLSTSSLSLTPGQTATLTATVSPSNATNKNVTYTSDNPGIATINSSGVVTAVAAGSANITVTTIDGGKTATCAVTVKIPVTGVTLTPSNLTMGFGQTATLIATVFPSNATNKNVSWSSSEPGIYFESPGVLRAHVVGTSTVTVTTEDGNKTATCLVTVTTAIPVTEVTISLLMKTGQTSPLAAIIAPSDATDKEVSWASDNTNVATVSSAGVITAVAEGSAIITVTTQDDNRTDAFWVTVTSTGTLTEGDTTAVTKVHKAEPSESLFSIYPVPVSTRLYLDVKEEGAITSVDILDILGKTIETRNNLQEMSLDVSNLSSGIYFIRTIINKKEFVQKFIKE